MIIRDAAEADLPAIIEIYNAATATRTSTAMFEPVSVEERLPWFCRHSPNDPDQHRIASAVSRLQ